MGNDTTPPKVDREIISSILNNDNKPNRLSVNQVYELFRQYNKIYHVVLKTLYLPICPHIISMRQCISDIEKVKTIGYYRGDIVAFSVHGSPLPYIIFECNNLNFQHSIKLIKPKNKQRVDGYACINNENTIVLTLLYVVEDYSYSQYYWVHNIKEKEEEHEEYETKNIIKQ